MGSRFVVAFLFGLAGAAGLILGAGALGVHEPIQSLLAIPGAVVGCWVGVLVSG